MAVPILMTFKICCDHIESLSAIGEFLSGRQVEAESREDAEPSRIHDTRDDALHSGANKSA